MKQRKTVLLFRIAVLAAVMVLGFAGCATTGSDNGQSINADTLAQAFQIANAVALALDVDSVTADSEGIVQTALTAYNALSGTVKSLLGDEKALLDSLQEKIDEEKAAAQ